MQYGQIRYCSEPSNLGKIFFGSWISVEKAAASKQEHYIFGSSVGKGIHKQKNIYPSA